MASPYMGQDVFDPLTYTTAMQIKQHPTSRKKGAQYASIEDGTKNVYKQLHTDNQVTCSETKETSIL